MNWETAISPSSARTGFSASIPWRSLIKRGIVAALTSDAPVIDPNPMHGIYFAVTRKTPTGQSIAPHEAVTVLQAIRAYTMSGAYRIL